MCTGKIVKATPNIPVLVGLVSIGMSATPHGLRADLAAFLVEFFPARIRYTSLSLPYHLGNGEFGGWLPFIATAIVAETVTAANPLGDIYAGLWYPIAVAVLTAIVGWFCLPETNHRNIWDEIEGGLEGNGFGATAGVSSPGRISAPVKGGNPRRRGG